MAWTSMPTWAASGTLTASEMNTYVRDNGNFLFNGKAYTIVQDSTSGTTVATSGTVWGDVTGMAGTVTVVSGRLRCHFSSAFTVNNVTNAFLHLRLTCNGTQFAAIMNKHTDTAHDTVSFVGGKTGLAAGSYVIQLQWYMTAQTVTMIANTDSYATLVIEEV